MLSITYALIVEITAPNAAQQPTARLVTQAMNSAKINLLVILFTAISITSIGIQQLMNARIVQLTAINAPMTLEFAPSVRKDSLSLNLQATKSNASSLALLELIKIQQLGNAQSVLTVAQSVPKLNVINVLWIIKSSMMDNACQNAQLKCIRTMSPVYLVMKPAINAQALLILSAKTAKNTIGNLPKTSV